MKHKTSLVLTIVCMVTVPSMANDWPSWRGPEQTGQTREKAAVTSWSKDGTNVLWKVPIGGWSAPVVQKGRVYLLTPLGEGPNAGERVVCLDAMTGKTIWERRFHVFHSDVAGKYVGRPSLTADPKTSYLYVHTTGGEFLCLDWGGKTVWEHALTEVFGRMTDVGAHLQTPLLDEARVVLGMTNASWGNHLEARHRYVAVDTRSGSVIWWAEPGGEPVDLAISSTPAVGVIGKRRMLVVANADGNVYGMLARTAQKVWTFRLGQGGTNASILIDGDHVIAAHGGGDLDGGGRGRVVCIDATREGDITQEGEIWRAEGLAAGNGSPALAHGRLYIADDSGELHCLDARTGKRHWTYKLGGAGGGSPVVTADRIIYVADPAGVLHILRDEGDKCVSLDRDELGSGKSLQPFLGAPAVANGRVYFMDRGHTYCLGAKKVAVEAAAIPPSPDEPWDLRRPVYPVVVPSDLDLPPGGPVAFDVWLHDKFGAYQRSSREALEHGLMFTVFWTAKGIYGEIDLRGNYVAPSKNEFAAGLLQAEFGSFKASIRVRVAPPLPVHETFDLIPVESPPPGWLGMEGFSEVIELGDGYALEMHLDSPSLPETPIRGFVMPPIKGGYVVMTDFMVGLEGSSTLPDVGLINSRYTLVLQGKDQRLVVSAWEGASRLRKEVPLSFEAKVWYRIKFQVVVEGEKGRVRAKVWPRDAKEPDAWTLEAIDTFPQRKGSPGIYLHVPKGARGKGSVIQLDDFRITQGE